MPNCTSCGDDQAPIHWRGYCHACCLTKPGYAQFLEGEVERFQACEEVELVAFLGRPNTLVGIVGERILDAVRAAMLAERKLAAEAKGE